MTFRNPILGGTTLLRAAIQSPNYAKGSAGWIISQSGSAEFNNLTLRNGEIVSSDSLYYNGTPAAGNLTVSISEDAGTDDYGNNYLSGITVYDPGFSYANLDDAALVFGGYVDGQPDPNLSNGAAVNQSGSGLLMTSDVSTNNPNASTLTLTPGPTGVSVPNGNEGVAILRDSDTDSVVSLGLTGVVTPYDLTGAPRHTTVVGASGAPAYTTNWQASTSYGSISSMESLRYAMLATGHIHVHGAFMAGATAPSANEVFALPSGYFRTDRAQPFTWHAILSGGAETIGTGTVQTNGAVQLSSTNTSSTSPRVAGAQLWMNFIIDGPGVY